MDMGGQDPHHSQFSRRRGNTKFSANHGSKKGIVFNHRKHNRSFASHLTSNVSGITSSLTSNFKSNLTPNLTGRAQNLNSHHNTTSNEPHHPRRGSMDSTSSPLTINHLLRGKTALTSKTKRVVARGLVAVPPAARKKVIVVNHVKY